MGLGLAINLDENLIEMAAPMRVCQHVTYPFSTDLGGKHRAKPVPPEPHSLMKNGDAALGQQVFDVAQLQGVFHVHQHHQPDDFRRRIEIPKKAFGLGHPVQITPLLISVNFALTTP